MKSNCLLLSLFFLCPFFLLAQNGIEGRWKTVDDNTGKERSVVEIFKKGDQYFGKIIWLQRKPGEDPNPVCDDCDPEDDRYKQPVIGLEIIRNMRSNDSEYSGGTVLDPENGSVYNCKIWLEDGKLMLRGYVVLFYRTQTWHRFEGKI